MQFQTSKVIVDKPALIMTAKSAALLNQTKTVYPSLFKRKQQVGTLDGTEKTSVTLPAVIVLPVISKDSDDKEQELERLPSMISKDVKIKPSLCEQTESIVNLEDDLDALLNVSARPATITQSKSISRTIEPKPPASRKNQTENSASVEDWLDDLLS
jgi:hypothetical protein